MSHEIGLGVIDYLVSVMCFIHLVLLVFLKFEVKKKSIKTRWQKLDQKLGKNQILKKGESQK